MHPNGGFEFLCGGRAFLNVNATKPADISPLSAAWLIATHTRNPIRPVSDVNFSDDRKGVRRFRSEGVEAGIITYNIDIRIMDQRTRARCMIRSS